jgi:hypothetical protein
MNNTQEHQRLVHEILIAVGGMPDVRVWKQVNGMAIPYGAEHPVHFGGPNGQGDIGGIMRVSQLVDPDGGLYQTRNTYGVRLEIEVKTGSGRPSKEQIVYQKMIEKFGGIYILARSVDDALRPIQNALRFNNIR